MQQTQPQNHINKPVQLFPAAAQTALTIAIGRERQCQQSEECQRTHDNIRTLDQLHTQLSPIQPKDEQRIHRHVQHYISKTPQPQLTTHNDPSRPAGQTLQRRHGQGNQQHHQGREPEVLYQDLSRIRPQGKDPCLIEPPDRRNTGSEKYSQTPKRIAHQ
ncbi:hypothetical protein ALP29_200756 [Pseudomonas syringae pv. avii]|uniref:Uncharacterized protein n=1 Tax=Pseudomonas syringae pv. avii TaxID=663959 RepID=A0A3M5W312_PSESX|nr:hypothetical protein ALP29_200756 [Pseudomonas syringae pv. avii]